MDFDQNLFSYFLKLKKNRKDNQLIQLKSQKDAIELESVKDSLNVYSSAIFKKTLEIRSTESFPHLSGNKIYLPSFIATEQGKTRNYLFYKIIILHLYAVKKYLPQIETSLGLYQDLAKIEGIKNECIRLLSSEFPNYPTMMRELTEEWTIEDFFSTQTNEKEFKINPYVGLERKILWGKLPQKTNLLEADDKTPITREALPEGATEKQKKTGGQIKKVNIDEEKENIGQDVFHHFEKVETAEEYKGIQREMDGADDLESHADALDELNIEEVVRSSKSAQSFYKTELDLGFEVTDLKSTNQESDLVNVFHYDEWDEKKHSYKKNWCQVLHEKQMILPKEKLGKKKSLVENLKERQFEVSKIRKKLIQLTSEIFVKKKLLDGRMIDIDNYIRNQSFLKAKMSGDGRLYQEVIKKHRDMCVLLLVDCSLSSDSWVQNKRVLDISLEALLVFGEASKGLNDAVMVAGFNSNTRNACKFLEWKSFEEEWSSFKNKVDDINPEGYTRIGPAIRHANFILSQRSEKNKLLLIFTDGRPTDYDRYEGSYGLSDVRKAIKESDNCGVVTFAIAVDPSAKQFLPNLFGTGNYQILMNIQKLPEILTRLYVRLAKGF